MRCHPGTPSSTLARCHQLERRCKSPRSLLPLAASPACDSATQRTTFHLHKPAYPTIAPSGPSSRHAARRCSHANAYHSTSLQLPPLLLFYPQPEPSRALIPTYYLYRFCRSNTEGGGAGMRAAAARYLKTSSPNLAA